MLSSLRLRIVALLLTVLIVAASSGNVGEREDEATAVNPGKRPQIPVSLTTIPTSPQYEFDPDLLRSLLSDLESEPSSHDTTTSQTTGQLHPWQPFHASENAPALWHHADGPSSLSQPEQHGYRYFTPDEHQVGSSRARDSVSDPYHHSTTEESASKRTKSLERVADAVGSFQTSTRPGEPRVLSNIIQQYTQEDASPESEKQALTPDIEYTFSTPNREGQGQTLPPSTESPSSVDFSSATTEARKAKKKSPSYSEPTTYQDNGYRPSWTSSVPNELRNIPTTASPSLRNPDHRHVYEQIDNENIREIINNQVFAGKLQWIDRKTVPYKKFRTYRTRSLLPTRVLPMPDIPKIQLPEGQGSIKSIRVTFHGGVNHVQAPWPEGHPLNGQKYLTFWGISEGKLPHAPGLVQNYGIAYLEMRHHPEVNERLRLLKKMIAEKASEAAHLHG